MTAFEFERLQNVMTKLSDTDLTDSLRRTFEQDGNRPDPTYVRVVLLQWINIDSLEDLNAHAAKLRDEQIHESDRELLGRFYLLFKEMNDAESTSNDDAGGEAVG